MKHIIKKGSAKLGGLIFYDDPKALEFTDWVKKGCPDGYVKITPDISVLTGIPIVDAKKMDAIYYKQQLIGPLQEVKYRVFQYMMPRENTKKDLPPLHLDYLEYRDPRRDISNQGLNYKKGKKN